MFESPTGPVGAASPGTGLYLFCFSRASLVIRDDERGLEETQPLLQWVVEDVAAVACPTDLGAFTGPGSETRMRDMAWVGPRALRHQQVVERVLRDAPVLPCRFGTLFSSADVLLDLVAKLRPLIVRFLDNVADKEEWAVKAFLDPGRSEAWLRTTEPELIERSKQLASAPGRRYFQEKQLLAEVRQHVRRWGREVTQRLQQTLAAWATAVHSLRLSAGSETAEVMLLNNSLLVARDRVADLCAGVARLNSHHADHGITVELSGPWPPYSFSPSLAPNPEPVDEVSRLLHYS